MRRAGGASILTGYELDIIGRSASLPRRGGRLDCILMSRCYLLNVATRRKVSTQLDDILFRRVRLEAVRQGRQISTIISDALLRYLDERGTPAGPGGAVAASWAALAAPPEAIASVLEEDDFLGA